MHGRMGKKKVLAYIVIFKIQNCEGWKEPLEISQSNPLLKPVPSSRLHS